MPTPDDAAISALTAEVARLAQQNQALNEWYADLKHLAKDVLIAYDSITTDLNRRTGMDASIERLRLQVVLPVPTEPKQREG